MSLVPSDSLRKFLETAVSRYHEKLLAGHAAAEYLAQRGITPEMIVRYRLGVVADPLPGHEQFEGSVVIPYLAPDGEVITMRLRHRRSYGSKYHTFQGDTGRLFNTAVLNRGTRGVGITEGEFDAMVAEHLCGIPTVAAPGATTWKTPWNALFVNYPNVIVLQDDDDAGQKFADMVMREIPGARSVVMTGGDVNEFYLTHGAQALRDKVLGAKA